MTTLQTNEALAALRRDLQTLQERLDLIRKEGHLCADAAEWTDAAAVDLTCTADQIVRALRANAMP
jgi:hypothetical protein